MHERGASPLLVVLPQCWVLITTVSSMSLLVVVGVCHCRWLPMLVWLLVIVVIEGSLASMTPCHHWSHLHQWWFAIFSCSWSSGSHHQCFSDIVIVTPSCPHPWHSPYCCYACPACTGVCLVSAGFPLTITFPPSYVETMQS